MSQGLLHLLSQLYIQTAIVHDDGATVAVGGEGDMAKGRVAPPAVEVEEGAGCRLCRHRWHCAESGRRNLYCFS